MKRILYLVLVLACGLAVPALRAQDAVPPPAPDYQPLTAQQLDQLLGPIALYPDPLMAEILPASTLPTQIVLADRYLAGGGDPNQIDQQPWDNSVKALARYPSVLKWMDDNLNWTTMLGQAFMNQQQDVMDSVQRLRASAYNLGNLQSTPQQQVIDDGGQIEIFPVDPQVVYVPVYQPDTVYYQSPVGPPFITFSVGYPIGPWLYCDFDWHNRHLIYWSHQNPRPANWWHEPWAQRQAAIARHPMPVWRPPADRPGYRGGNQGDRGWNNNTGGSHGWSNPGVSHTHQVQVPPPHSTVVVTPGIHPGFQGASHPVPGAPVQRFTPSSPAPSAGAFIGIQNANDARNYSDRGRESMGNENHFVAPSRPAPAPAPVQHSAPAPRPAPSGGGGGGSHFNQQPRH